MIADHSQRLTSDRWEEAVNRALDRVNGLSREDKLAIALHDFVAVTAEDFVPFDYGDGPNVSAGTWVRRRFRPHWRSLPISTVHSPTATVPHLARKS